MTNTTFIFPSVCLTWDRLLSFPFQIPDLPFLVAFTLKKYLNCFSTPLKYKPFQSLLPVVKPRNAFLQDLTPMTSALSTKYSFRATSTFMPLSFLLFSFLFIAVQVQLFPFSPHHSPLFHPSLLPTLEPSPLGFVHVSFIHVPWCTSPYFPPLSLSPLVTVSLFLISMSLVIFCWLVCFVD